MNNSHSILETEILVLRKTPYGETSLIIAGLTPDTGLVSILVRGARKVGKKDFPIVDLFRKMGVVLRQGRGELLSLTQVELLTDYGMVATDRTTYVTASWLAKFALQNVMPGMEHPEFYEAILTSFERLCTAVLERTAVSEVSKAAVVGAAVAFLREAGWLDHYRHDPVNAEKCRRLIEMASGRAPVPDLSLDAWKRLQDWALAQLRQVECHVPEEMGTH